MGMRIAKPWSTNCGESLRAPTVEGNGLTASLLRRMVAASRTVTTTVVDTTPLDDQVFAITGGWKTRNK